MLVSCILPFATRSLLFDMEVRVVSLWIINVKAEFFVTSHDDVVSIRIPDDFT